MLYAISDIEKKLEQCTKNKPRLSERPGLTRTASSNCNLAAIPPKPDVEKVAASHRPGGTPPTSHQGNGNLSNRRVSSSDRSQRFRSQSPTKGEKKTDQHIHCIPGLQAEIRPQPKETRMPKGGPEQRTGLAAKKKGDIANRKPPHKRKISKGGPENQEGPAVESNKYKANRRPNMERKTSMGGPELRESLSAENKQCEANKQESRPRSRRRSVPATKAESKAPPSRQVSASFVRATYNKGTNQGPNKPEEEKVVNKGPTSERKTISKNEPFTSESSYGSNVSGNDSRRQKQRNSPAITLDSVISKTHYEVLQLSHQCTNTEIKKSYRKMALMCHPDRNNDASAVEIFQYIQIAYETLSDDIKRMCYDADLRAQILRPNY